MKDIDVTITELTPMRVVSFLGFGENPESLAWNKVASFLEENNFTDQNQPIRIFGFNNPCPSAGSTKYGYEFWVTNINHVEMVKCTQDFTVKDYTGGLYATTPIKVSCGEEIPEWWQSLNVWCETSPFTISDHQWLEEHTIKGHPISLWLPIKKK